MMLLYSLYFLLFNFSLLPINENTLLKEGVLENDLQIDVIVEGSGFLSLGDSVQLILATNKPQSEIQSVVWEPFISCSDCFLVYVKIPWGVDEICYTATVTDLDGCVKSDQVCLFQENCEENNITVNALNGISPDPNNLDKTATINFQLYNTQYVIINAKQNGEVKSVIEERWFKKGGHEYEINLENLPSGTYDLELDLYPEKITQKITINH